MTSSAPTLANPHGEEIKNLMMSIWSANGAENLSGQTNMPNGVFVVLPVEQKLLEQRESPRVYDLTIEGCPEFFANGILVHNCLDALRYALDGYITNPDSVLWERMARL